MHAIEEKNKIKKRNESRMIAMNKRKPAKVKGKMQVEQRSRSFYLLAFFAYPVANECKNRVIKKTLLCTLSSESRKSLFGRKRSKNVCTLTRDSLSMIVQSFDLDKRRCKGL